MANAHQELYVSLVLKARDHALKCISHSERSYTFVVDYGQNMELPCFNYQQSGSAYYLTLLSIYKLGMVNQAHANEDEKMENHLYAHVYHERVGSVSSLIVKTLKLLNLLNSSKPGGELNIVFDNCTGQNKNNTVLCLVPWLTKMGYFKQMKFVFLIVGHTKNAADCLFNTLKLGYRKSNIFTLPELFRY